MEKIITFIICIITCGNGVVQQLEIYPDLNQGGNPTIFADKVPDLVSWKPVFQNAKSYCVTGMFDFFRATNYLGNRTTIQAGGLNEVRRCDNFAGFDIFNSARFVGPKDTRTLAFSFYEGAPEYDPYGYGQDYWRGGPEIVVETRGATNFPIINTRFVLQFGGADWTLFRENDFEGDSLCFESYGNILSNYHLDPAFKVRSVFRGCV